MTGPFIERGGYRFIANMYVCDTERVRRSWRERLFTRPWRPLERTKSIYSPKALRLHNGVFLVSYQTFTKLHQDAEWLPPSG